MEDYLPLFPLNLVVYPGETLNLHVFEPRYRQLAQECVGNDSTFGIPSYLDSRVTEYGTEVRITKVEKKYADGRMDIRTRGERVFRLRTFDNPAPQKLYAGGEVEFTSDFAEEDAEARLELLEKARRLYQLLNIDVAVGESDQLLSYEIAHRMGLSLDQEYELLTYGSERERQEYLLSHLRKTLPVVEEMERTKARVRQNGHFKHFDPLNF